MSYYIDLSKITIDQYKKILKQTDLLPSWKILGENIDENLNIIIKHNINNMFDLQTALKNKKRVQEFSAQSGLSEKYLTVLRRVVNGYQPKPNNFKDFPDISEDILIRLDAIGIKNTLQLYEEIITPECRDEFSKKTGIEINDVLRITQFTDLSRIRWVNHTFAYVLMEAGFVTAEIIAKTEPKDLYFEVKNLNEKRKIYKANIGVNDMKLVIESAKGLDIEIEY
ncbi:MAG: DUF4332 domain-containing protein [Candidatus Peribacteraceae bacterium]|nr:DUF4332 domain-containing protein [Candidatus Peribacteraceae bacterium]